MKVFIILVSLSLVLLGNGQQIKVDQGHGPDPVPVQHVHPVVTEHIAVGQNVGHTTHVHNQHNVPQHSKVSVQVPAHDHQVVTQVSQHVPVVPVQQHVAKQRSMRSIIGKAGKCDFKCADTDNAICGFNGRCHRQFDNQCELSAHNCLNAHKIFHQVEDFMCENPDTIKCYPGDD